MTYVLMYLFTYVDPRERSGSVFLQAYEKIKVKNVEKAVKIEKKTRILFITYLSRPYLILLKSPYTSPS